GAEIASLLPEQLARRGLSRTFQNLQVFLHMSALENVMVGRHRHETTGTLADLLHLPMVKRQNEATRRASLAALERVGLAAIADRVHVLAGGRTLAEGTAAEVRANPAVIEAYLGIGHGREDARAVD